MAFGLMGAVNRARSSAGGGLNAVRNRGMLDRSEYESGGLTQGPSMGGVTPAGVLNDSANRAAREAGGLRAKVFEVQRALSMDRQAELDRQQQARQLEQQRIRDLASNALDIGRMNFDQAKGAAEQEYQNRQLDLTSKNNEENRISREQIAAENRDARTQNAQMQERIRRDQIIAGMLGRATPESLNKFNQSGQWNDIQLNDAWRPDYRINEMQRYYAALLQQRKNIKDANYDADTTAIDAQLGELSKTIEGQMKGLGGGAARGGGISSILAAPATLVGSIQNAIKNAQQNRTAPQPTNVGAGGGALPQYAPSSGLAGALERARMRGTYNPEGSAPIQSFRAPTDQTPTPADQLVNQFMTQGYNQQDAQAAAANFLKGGGQLPNRIVPQQQTSPAAPTAKATPLEVEQVRVKLRGRGWDEAKIARFLKSEGLM